MQARWFHRKGTGNGRGQTCQTPRQAQNGAESLITLCLRKLEINAITSNTIRRSGLLAAGVLHPPLAPMLRRRRYPVPAAAQSNRRSWKERVATGRELEKG